MRSEPGAEGQEPPPERRSSGSASVTLPCEVTLRNPLRISGLGARRLRRWLEGMVRELAPDRTSLAVLLTSDRELRRLNAVYRGKDSVTDVLSFPGERSPDGAHLGDIAVSVPAARRQAARAGHSLVRELEILLLHGVLHCLGHDHEHDDGTMDRLERRLRRRWVGHA